MVSRALFAVAITGLLVAPAAMAAMTSIDADGFADGTDISNAFAGVTLSVVGSGYSSIDGNVYARTAHNAALASTGLNVFGTDDNGTDTHGNPFDEIWWTSTQLRADFALAADYVAIDVIGNNSSDVGTLWAYDSGGTLLDSATTGVLSFGDVSTLGISRPSFDIAYVIAGGIQGDTVHLDNLVANQVPAPGALFLAIVGLGVFGSVRRRLS